MTIPAPDYEWAETVDSGVVKNDPAYGAVMRGRTRTVDVLYYDLTWTALYNDEMDDLMDDFNAAKGAAGDTSYTPVGESTPVTVKYDSDELEHRPDGSLWEARCRLWVQPVPYT